jgi:hypothetical protein
MLIEVLKLPKLGQKLGPDRTLEIEEYIMSVCTYTPFSWDGTKEPPESLQDLPSRWSSLFSSSIVSQFLVVGLSWSDGSETLQTVLSNGPGELSFGMLAEGVT